MDAFGGTLRERDEGHLVVEGVQVGMISIFGVASEASIISKQE
jgi:hypothetical protein